MSRHLYSYYCSTVQPHCVIVGRNRCQEDLNSLPLGELEETTGTLSYCIQGEVIGFHVLLDSLHPRVPGRPGGLLHFSRGEYANIFI